jgi:hypothetical protein
VCQAAAALQPAGLAAAYGDLEQGALLLLLLALLWLSALL